MNLYKFIPFAAIVTLLLFSLNGCAGPAQNMQQHKIETSMTIPVFKFLDKTIDPNRPLRPYFSANSNYEIHDQKYVDRNERTKTNVSIYYPQISRTNRDVNEKKINQILKDTALHNYKEEMEISGLLLERDYMITLSSPDILSVCFIGYYNVQGTPHPSAECFASTIDMKRAVSLKLEDIVAVEKLFSKDNRAHFKLVSGNQELLDTYTYDDLFETYLQYPDDQTHTSDFYLTDNALGIIVGVPHAVGDYAVLEIPYSAIKSILKQPF